MRRGHRWIQRTMGASRRPSREGGGKADAYSSQRSGCDTICDYYSLYGVSLVPTRNSVRGAFLRTHHIDKLQDSSCAFHTRVNRVELQIVRRSATRETKGEPRDERYMSVEARRGEQPKTDEKLCISETECHPSNAVSLESTLS